MGLHRLSPPGLNVFISALEASAQRSYSYLARTSEVLLLNAAQSLEWEKLTSAGVDIVTARVVREERDRIAKKIHDKFMANDAPSSSFLQRTIEIAAVRSEDEWSKRGILGEFNGNEWQRIEDQRGAINRAKAVFRIGSFQSSCGSSFAGSRN